MSDKPLANPRWERFATLVALEMLGAAEAYRQCGYSHARSASAGSALALKRPIASRIETLRSKANAQTAVKCDVTRASVVSIVSRIMRTGKSDLVRLKAVEILNKMQGYNEPELRNVHHVHLQVDGALADQLRAGVRELSTHARDARARLHAGCVLEAVTGGVDTTGSTPPASEGTGPVPSPPGGEPYFPEPLPKITQNANS